MGAGGAIFVASGILTLKSVLFENNTATGGTGGNSGQGLGGALFIFDNADNGGNAAPGTTNDPLVSGCDLTFSGNSASTSNNDTYGSIGFASGCPLILTAEGPAGPLASGAPVTVTIKVDKFTNIGTLQFSITWDPTELQLDSNTPLTIDDDAPLIGTPASGQLTYSWFDSDIDYGVTLPDGTTILTLNFTIVTPGPATDVNVDLTDDPTTVDASDSNFESVPVTLENLVSFEVTAPITVKPLVLVANKITLKSTKQSTPAGDIHSNGLLTVEKGYPSTYKSNLTAVGKITIYTQNTINGDVKSQTSISNAGTITGTKTVGTVNNEALPSLSYSAGGLSKIVPQNGTLALSPGSYNHVTLGSYSKLQLTSGDYYFTSLKYSGSTVTTVVIEIDLSSGDPITLNVANNLYLGNEVEIRLLPNGEADSKLVTINTRQSTAVTLGREAYLIGSFNAPNAKVTLAKNSQLRGSLCAKEILVSTDCLFLHHDSPGSLPGPGNLPKPSLDDDDEQPATSDQQQVTSYQLEQNYPNPFNPTTTISFALPQAGEVSLSIFNTSGQLVKKLVAGAMNAGQHTLVWDATNERGERVASGVYLYVLKAGEFTAQRKLVLMK
ncbi:T9SS type A sorting domain-containing protein [bacterium]|nr:T9SS type A sorting domain-containing protein [bacterium]